MILSASARQLPLIIITKRCYGMMPRPKLSAYDRLRERLLSKNIKRVPIMFLLPNDFMLNVFNRARNGASKSQNTTWLTRWTQKSGSWSIWTDTAVFIPWWPCTPTRTLPFAARYWLKGSTATSRTKTDHLFTRFLLNLVVWAGWIDTWCIRCPFWCICLCWSGDYFFTFWFLLAYWLVR